MPLSPGQSSYFDTGIPSASRIRKSNSSRNSNQIDSQLVNIPAGVSWRLAAGPTNVFQQLIHRKNGMPHGLTVVGMETCAISLAENPIELGTPEDIYEHQ